jgi:hypothetical protein
VRPQKTGNPKFWVLPKASRASLEIGEAIFCLDLLDAAKSVAIRMDRTLLFTVEVGSSRLSVRTQYVGKVAYKSPLFRHVLSINEWILIPNDCASDLLLLPVFGL